MNFSLCFSTQCNGSFARERKRLWSFRKPSVTCRSTCFKRESMSSDFMLKTTDLRSVRTAFQTCGFFLILCDICLFGFLTSSPTTRLYRRRVPRLTSDNFMCCHTERGDNFSFKSVNSDYDN